MPREWIEFGILIVALVTIGCQVEPGHQNINDKRGAVMESNNNVGRKAKRIRGVDISVDKSLWKEFVEDKIIVDIEGVGDITVNTVHFSNEVDAKNECLRLSKETKFVGAVVIMHEKGASAKWIENVCEQSGLDCFVRRAVGGIVIVPHESLEWVHRGRADR